MKQQTLFFMITWTVLLVQPVQASLLAFSITTQWRCVKYKRWLYYMNIGGMQLFCAANIFIRLKNSFLTHSWGNWVESNLLIKTTTKYLSNMFQVTMNHPLPPVNNSTILCCTADAQRVLSQPSCLLGIILLTSMLLPAKMSLAFSMVESGRVRVRPRIQAKSTWKSLRTSVQEYTRAEFT